MLLHYLDDFILVTKDHSEAIIQKNIVITTWDKLGVPMEPSKLEGPSQTLKFLGIKVNTVNLQLHLPEDKLCQLKKELASLILERTVSKSDLESLVGYYNLQLRLFALAAPF